MQKEISKSKYGTTIAQSRAANATLHIDQVEEPTAAQLERFETADSIVPALMLHWSNSGLIHTRAVASVRADPANDDAAERADLKDALDSIGEPVTIKRQSELVKKFNAAWNREARLYGCGCCGVVAFESSNDKFNRMPLKDPLMKVLILSEAEIVHHDLYGEYKDVCSVFTHPRIGSTRYHLHPELVDDNDTTLICPSCHYIMQSKKKAPPMSVKNVDFLRLSRHQGLEPLTDIERMVLQSVRVYGLRYLIRSSTTESKKFSGHCIAFVQDSASALTARFSSWNEVLDDVVKNITVVFVGKREEYETWKGKKARLFQVSSKKILAYFRALSVIFGPNICKGRQVLMWTSMALSEENLKRLDNLHDEIAKATISCESEALLEEILKVGSSVATANESDGNGD